jgi:hypothetical protein
VTPQSNIMVVAPIRPEHKEELRGLLASMNTAPGQVNPSNPLFPFRQFGQIHFARFVILDDQTLDDITVYGLPRVDYPVALAFIADFDGSAEGFRDDISRRAAPGLRRIFSCCEGFEQGTDLLTWMEQREHAASTFYQNWRGRTVVQVREENQLRLALGNYIQSNAAGLSSKTPDGIHAALREFVGREMSAGRLSLTDPEPTPAGWWLRNALHFVGVPLIVLLVSPLLLLYLPFFIYLLRVREKTDREIAPRVDPYYREKLARLEDHDVTNQFTVVGAIKPGLFRLTTMRFLLWAMNWTTRHIYIRGHLARISTIHAARWVFINERKRMVFASNYDGSLDSYMDDFINKVGWGLNLVFSNGVSYPTTNWLVLDGSKDEQKYKYVLRRHQQPTEVWYKAYPGLTAVDLKRNTLIREGIQRRTLTPPEVREWIALF